ncbi:hypothetical protein AgCh_005317 [Apium graveolens]
MDIDDKEEPGVPVMKVSQIQKLTEDYIEKQVCCQLTVKKVDENMSWYIPICTHCDIEIVEVHKKFKCPTPECARVYPYPDTSDELGTILVVWPDDEICRITGKTVYDVVGDDPEVEKGQQLPKMLKLCEKKTYNFTIIITETNVKEGSKVYKASQISEVEISASHSPSLNQTLKPVATEMSIGNDSHEINLKDTTPPTAKSLNKSKSVVERNEKVDVKESQQGKSFIKFKINDGCKKINVTFWNAMATEFESAMEDVSEEPVIIIIGSGRVSKWHDEIDICNYSPTKFFLDYENHSVTQLRKIEVRTILGKNAFDVEKQDDSFPPIIKSLQARDYTIKIPITEENIVGEHKIYEVNGIFEGWNMKQEIINEQLLDPHLTSSMTQGTTRNGEMPSQESEALVLMVKMISIKSILSVGELVQYITLVEVWFGFLVVVGWVCQLAYMVRFKQTARKTCDVDAYVRAQQRAHSSSSSGSADTIAFSVYAELRREFDMLQGKYDRVLDRFKNVYPDSRNYEGKPKEQMTARLETLVQYVNTKLEEMPSHRDRTS